MTDPLVRRAGPGSGDGGAPTAVALSPILSARYRSRDLERIRAAAPGARLVMVSVEGLADGPLDDVEVMLRGWLSSDAFDRILVRAPRLSWVHSATSGVERALTPAALERGVVVTNARGVFSRPIAEYVLMMILSVSRRLPQLLELQRERTWQPLEGTELRDVTVGIVGLGSIGRAVGALATAFGCRVVAVRRRGDAGAAGPDSGEDGRPLGEIMLDRVGGPETLPELLAESDFIVLAAPLTPETEEMINAETLAMVKPGAWLINVARGRLIDERALIRALRDGDLGGAVLDTFRDEPLAADVLVLRPPERDRHAPHGLVERAGPGPIGGAVLRQPAPLRDGRAAAQRGRSERRVLTGGYDRAMQIAIVGLAGSGKTTVFNTLTRGHAETGGYGGVTLNVGVVKVPDARLDTLAGIFKPKKIVQADVTYVDLPAPPASSEGHVGTEELPADHLARLRDSDAMLHVVRAFEDPANPHPDGSVDPARDIERLDLEFMLADLAMAERRLERLKTSARHGTAGRARGRRARGGRRPAHPRRSRGRLADPRPGPRSRRREGDPGLPLPDPEAGPRPAQRRRRRTWRPLRRSWRG